MKRSMSRRVTFATRLGAIAATVGSAVGLGNIWRFPYEAGQNGGRFKLAIQASVVFCLRYVAPVVVVLIFLWCVGVIK